MNQIKAIQALNRKEIENGMYVLRCVHIPACRIANFSTAPQKLRGIPTTATRHTSTLAASHTKCQKAT